MPSVPIPIISTQQGGTSSLGGQNHINKVQTLAPSSTTPVQTSGHGSTPTIHSESSPNTPDQSNPIGEGISTQSNTIGEGECTSSRGQRTLVTLAPTGLEPSGLCSKNIFKSFKHELDPNGINWKSVSDEIKNFYWGEFKKKFYWDSSIASAVRSQWENKASIRNKCKIVVAVGVESPPRLTHAALSPMGSIARDLLLKRVETQHQVRYICTSIHMGMLENLFLMRKLESCMKGIKKYYKNKHKLNLILINVKHITKPREGKRREEYMVLDLKQNATMDRIFVALPDQMLHHQYHLRVLNQHRTWKS